MSNIWSIKPYAVATLPVPRWECIFGLNDCSLQEITFWVWVLRCGDKIALIDTGLPMGSELENLNRANQGIDISCVFTPHMSLEQIFAKEQITPSDVSFALISQLVTYSTGGLSKRTLPNAKIYCAWGGMSELLTQNPGHPPRAFYFTTEGWNHLRDLLIEDRLIFAKTPLEIAPGLVYEPTGGHHPASAGIRVTTSAGIVGILETAFIQENIEKEIPIGIAENATACREVIRQYRRECDLTIAGHEPAADRLLDTFLQR